jgi:hypothetical protein
MMNPNSFSILGYLSVLLWLAVPLLWFLCRRHIVPGWLALVLALASFTFATHNSRIHVSRIQTEVKDDIGDTFLLEAAKRKAVEQARGGEVADIRFAEDGADDFIDKAGMDDADRKYLDSIDAPEDPAWKDRKKTRGETSEESGDLDDMIGGEEPSERLSTDALPIEKEPLPPIFMSQPDVAQAQRLNSFNINASFYAILLGIVILIVDYLSRANSYAHAAFPLPLPASWKNAFTPLPAIVKHPAKPRRNLTKELAHLARRGDAFVLFTKKPTSLPDSLPTIPILKRPIDLLRFDNDRITPTFLFESLWYRRSCFIVDSPALAHTLLTEILKQLELRHTARAHTRRNVHIVWNLDHPPSEKDLANLERLAPSTNFSLLLIKQNQ